MGSSRLDNEEAASFQSDYVPSMVIREHNKHIIQPPNFSSHSISKYFRTRIPSMFLTRDEIDQFTWNDVFNPFSSLKEMNGRQWNFFLVGFAGWTWDAFDFFLVSLNVSSIAKDLGKSVKDITWGITLVLMLRSVGAIIFGLWGDRYGRKWPYITNMFLLVILQIACGFVKDYKSFLGVRALFGIAMGGMFGNCAACACMYFYQSLRHTNFTTGLLTVYIVDDAPKKTRGFLSGAFQQGYAFGYLLVVIFQRAITDNSKYTWRALFWFSAGPAAIFMVWRFFLPETDTFLRQKQKLYENNEKKKSKVFEFSQEGKKAVKSYWLVLLYTVFLMSGFNFMSHGSQDLYPTLLTEQYDFSADRSTVTNSVANLGAITGGMVLGHMSTFIGRRLAIVVGCVLGGAMIYPWAFVKGSGINAGAFFLQAGVQGAWGVVPIHLSELSPPQFRSFVTGLSYQLGNLCSSASSTIESTIGERFPIHREGEEDIYDYAKVMSIFMGCVFAYLIIVTVFGPENRGADLGIERDEILDDDDHDVTQKSIDSIEHYKPGKDEKKPAIIHVE